MTEHVCPCAASSNGEPGQRSLGLRFIFGPKRTQVESFLAFDPFQRPRHGVGKDTLQKAFLNLV